MLNKLKRYLSEVVPDTQVTYLLSAVENIRTIKGDIIDFNLEQALYQCRDVDNVTGVDLIRQTILIYLDEAIAEYGIKLDEHALTLENILPLGNLLSGLIESETYEDKEALLALIDSSEDTNTCLSELIAMVTLTESTDYLPLIADVNPDLITKYRSYLLGVLEETITDDLTIKMEMSDKLKLFINLGCHEKVLPQLLDATKGQPHQLTLESILRLYGNQIADTTQSEYSWVYALFVAKNGPDVMYLMNIWGKYFMDEMQQMDAYNRVNTLHQGIITQLTPMEEDTVND